MIPAYSHTLFSALPADTDYFYVVYSLVFQLKKQGTNSSPSHGKMVNIPGWLYYKAILKTLLICLKYLKLIWLMCNFPNGSALFPYIDDLLPVLSSETAKEILSTYYNC